MKTTLKPTNYKRKKGKISHDIYYDTEIQKYVRNNVFNGVEILDPVTYIEALDAEKYYNNLLNNYINDIRVKEVDMSYKLFLDDVRMPNNPNSWKIAKNSKEAKEIVSEYGLPYHMSLDHDLGDGDDTMVFLKWLAEEYSFIKTLPSYDVHSANPVGKENIISFMKSWEKIINY